MGKYSKEAKPHTVLTMKFPSVEWKSRTSPQKSSLEALVKETKFLPLEEARTPHKHQNTSDTLYDMEGRIQVPFWEEIYCLKQSYFEVG